ncbi:Crp/Fnr family transcriptional regulator [Anoxynatronum buryatiense]|uniref:Transcriptional regulator, Crp/Fnr family n=1 Tax=Anoxynatronum buryatiense TaxID=489973 RepID=A0AA46AJL3_9CLOT|nr:Crp/Fnr family transcriptional regulator [Anoxynatronum buryatiense]SMP62705.1 transcriptional regulator, Crp/Fnr family [Anoxynatronum buryatiense]
MEACRGCGCESCRNSYCASKVSLFQQLDEAGLEKISSLIVSRKIKKGETIFHEGDLLSSLYIVNQGSVKAYTYNRDGKEQILYILAEGDFFGELSLLKEEAVEYRVTALEDTAFCVLAQEDFRRVLEDSPQVRDQVLAHAFDRIKSLEKLVQVLTSKDVDVRMAVLLINLAEGFGVRELEGTAINMPLSREDMAAYLGLTRETVSRRLSALQAEGILLLESGRRVIIRDMNRLKELIE